MIIRSKDKVQVGGKNKPVWVLDTDALTVTHNSTDAEPSECFEVARDAGLGDIAVHQMVPGVRPGRGRRI